MFDSSRRVKAGKIILGKTPMDRLLTTDTAQNITGNVTIDGDVILHGSIVDIDHLYTKNRIFGVDLEMLLEDSYFYSPNESIILTAEKTFENLTIGQLVIDGDFWQVGQSTGEIVKRFQELSEGITLHGDVTFTSSFNIKNLTVTDYINDIPCSEFGQQWLLYEGKQVS